MPTVKLPDGKELSFDKAVSVSEVAQNIGAGLAKAALAGRVDGKLVDLSYVIENDAEISIVTEKDDEGLDVIRHSTAHLLAQAVKQLFPEAQVTIGPVIEDGFYYDFAYERPFTPEDLEKIEKKMAELAKENFTVSRQTMSRDKAIAFFRAMGEEYKARIIEDIPKDQVLSLYQQGDFIDLCRGPHVPGTGKLKAFKLTKLAGAYWRGDSNNEMLQRIYGTAWASKKDLDAYLYRLEEAEKRDHRKLAKTLDLFHTQQESPGMIFWHHNGLIIYKEIEKYMREQLQKRDYLEVRTPQIIDRVLWEKSGHWEKFRDEMFTTETENREYAIKPMNCPAHVQIFNQRLHSYRELPIRMSEFGSCHRCEPSGTLHGLMRVRHMVQDDAHVFCTEDQIQSECAKMIDFVFDVYRDFGFTEIGMKLSTRPENRVGSDDVWDKAEHALEKALNEKKLDWKLSPGEGAFYGPKIEVDLKDCLGRVWQCGTIQVDFSMPERLGATYVAEDGSKQIPVMIHRAILGSFERFIGILIEHHAGNMPAWLAPAQAVVMNITDDQADFVREVTKMLSERGFRVKNDLRNEKINLKIRDHSMGRVPYLLVVGPREVENQVVAVRRQNGEDMGSMSLARFADHLAADILKKG